MIDAHIIKEVIKYWDLDQNHAHRDRTHRPVLEFQDVKDLIELAFHVSLKNEEGRPVKAALTFTKSEVENDPTHNYQKTIQKFERPIICSPSDIAKLAPAFEPEMSSLLVERDIGSQQLCCWGVSFYCSPLSRFNEVPVSMFEDFGLKLDLFTVSISAPGSLLISRGNSAIGRMVEGKFLPSTPSPFTVKALGKYLRENIYSSKSWILFENRYWHVYRAAIDLLLRESSKRGHGSTIVILPSNVDKNMFNLFKIKYTLTPPTDLSISIYNVLNQKDDKENITNTMVTTIAYHQIIIRNVQVLAKLATIDGALMLNSELKLIGFGVTLKANNSKKRVIVGPDGFGQSNGSIFQYQKYGTRHNSAIDFAASCKGATVFVISEDGPIRAFVSGSDQEVLCWEDCSEAMFV